MLPLKAPVTAARCIMAVAIAAGFLLAFRVAAAVVIAATPLLLASDKPALRSIKLY